jgi:hypothetical protein
MEAGIWPTSVGGVVKEEQVGCALLPLIFLFVTATIFFNALLMVFHE